MEGEGRAISEGGLMMNKGLMEFGKLSEGDRGRSDYLCLRKRVPGRRSEGRASRRSTNEMWKELKTLLEEGCHRRYSKPWHGGVPNEITLYTTLKT
jgi:hypothetical protein